MTDATHEWHKVKCAYCNGTGHDRWNLMSPLSTCSACSGRGYHHVEAPYRTCAHCGGAGVYPHLRVTCTTCGGVGSIHVPAHAVVCPQCNGAGRQPKSELDLSCTKCGGAGWVVLEAAHEEAV